MAHPNVVNKKDLAWEHRKNGEGFEIWRGPLSANTGGRKLGCSLYRQPPGKKAFPYHYHFAIEEAIYVLSGQADLRIGKETVSIGPGDFVSLPAGKDCAHQITNSGSEELVYMCMSTMDDPDVIAYPDSDKLGAMAGFSDPNAKTDDRVAAFFPRKAAVPYWTGEAEED